ncbi:TonB-dependent receptor [Pseudohongiella sp. SYSU M77423]|uniref:TonB-dependent receptor family protein n=1 Tax=Pseudohongiella sp. SYSU M77423 TaxID=3042312 RepID=UPI002480E828|nr:TonB-dependent receptor [Pseudohongiella sp. SYSU M77423]MDH7944843.1 TonB-dependent receptor [Pseudohongiella sp. SYSU M77423]
MKIRNKRLQFAVSAIIMGSTVGAHASNVEEFLIIGSREDARTVAGSGAVIDGEQIRIEAATDINQLLKTVPGVYIREEEGLGLRPNIGIRGATSERSSKVTIMEDGIMMAPAPYADPSAYYFPTATRQSTVEVLKGAPLLRYGPQTTGGVVNLVSTPIPQESAGSVQTVIDERGSVDLHAWAGGQGESMGWLLETVQRDGESFKDTDRSNDAGDYRIEDYVAKLGWQSTEGPAQSLLLKLQYSEETSLETYLGLTDADFEANPNRRYGLSSIDDMSNRHSSIQLSYALALSDNTSLSANAYQNNFKRNWFKLDGGGAYIDAANRGDERAQAILDGSGNVNGLRYKNNNRSYESRGVEVNLTHNQGDHLIEFGARTHEDESDRFQPVDVYNQAGARLIYDRRIQPGSGDNRVGSADAVTFWLTDTWQVTDALTVNAALRHENVTTSEHRYATLDRSSLNRITNNEASEWLPGVSLTYQISDSFQILAGVHRGFSPLGAGAQPNEDPETSDNYEAGFRFQSGTLFAELIGFYSDFSNKSENCSLASPCSNGETSGSYTTGEAVIQGLEVQFGNRFAVGDASVPFDFSYTLTDAEITRTDATAGVNKGDELKDVPRNIFSVRSGLELANGWNNYIVGKLVHEMCVSIGCNNSVSPYARTDTLFVTDLISRYTINNGVELFLKVENLFDKQKIVSRDPDGARPNKARTASVGFLYEF